VNGLLDSALWGDEWSSGGRGDDDDDDVGFAGSGRRHRRLWGQLGDDPIGGDRLGPVARSGSANATTKMKCRSAAVASSAASTIVGQKFPAPSVSSGFHFCFHFCLVSRVGRAARVWLKKEVNAHFPSASCCVAAALPRRIRSRPAPPIRGTGARRKFQARAQQTPKCAPGDYRPGYANSR
jgi:hypothetical protein